MRSLGMFLFFFAVTSSLLGCASTPPPKVSQTQVTSAIAPSPQPQTRTRTTHHQLYFEDVGR
jgi:hypothetical protein